MLARVRRAVAQQNLRAVVAEQFVERVNEAALAVEVEAERAQFQFIEGDVWKAFELETQSGNGVLGFDGGAQAIWRDPLGRGDFQRPESGVIAGFELAGIAVNGLRVKHRAARDGQPRAEFSLLRVEMKLHDGGRWNGADVVRIEDAQQGFRDFREFVVDLEMDARGQEGEGFDEALNVRIFAAVGVDEADARRPLDISRRTPRPSGGDRLVRARSIRAVRHARSSPEIETSRLVNSIEAS